MDEWMIPFLIAEREREEERMVQEEENHVSTIDAGGIRRPRTEDTH